MKEKEQEQPIVKRKAGGQPGHPHYRPPGSKGAPKGHPPYPGCGKPKIWTKERVDEIAEYFLDFIEQPTTIYFKEFALWLRQNHDIYFNKCYFGLFSETSERFKEVYEYAQMVQESKIAQGGLTKKLDSQMSKFMLCAVHGFTDRQTIEHEGKEEINIVHFGKGEPKTWNDEQQSSQDEP